MSSINPKDFIDELSAFLDASEKSVGSNIFITVATFPNVKMRQSCVARYEYRQLHS